MLNNKKILIFLFIIIILISIIVIFIKNKFPNLVTYEENLLGIKFNNYVINSSGKVEITSEYAKVKFEINSSLINNLKNDLNSNMHMLSEENYTMNFSNFKKTQLWNEISEDTKNMEILNYYQAFRSGKKVKTRDIYAVLCKDNNNHYYIYIYG